MQIPRVWLGIARIYAAFDAAFGLVLGQFFVGGFSLLGTIAGISALIAAAAGGRALTRKSAMARFTVLASATLGVMGVMLMAVEYYALHNMPGTDFAWELNAPLVIALAYIGFSATKLSDVTYGEAHAV